MKTVGSLVLVISTILFFSTAKANDPAPPKSPQAPPPTAAPASKFEAMCPEEVRTKQAASAPVKGWSSFVEVLNSRQIFTGATLSEGHPKDGVVLDAKPSPVDSTANETFFELPKGKDVFLVCQYGNTLVRLIQKLPKDLTTCRIRYSETLGHVQKAVCD
ncbi:MAG: STY0301 family protein [Bdellovibrionales bacterium]|nr:STY0301 family protein [Bdellovibrionales bacterium]